MTALFNQRSIEKIIEQENAKGKSAKDISNAVVVAMRAALAEGGSVRIKGFGAFKRVQIKPRTVVHPKTGEKIAVTSKSRIVFTMASELKESCRGEGE